MKRNADKRTGIDRRTFLAAGALGVAATGCRRVTSAIEPGPPRVAVRAPVYRTLGRTGLKLSVVGIGAMRTTEPAVFRAAFDRGVNYIDTARGYMGGKNERIVGEALKGYRDRVYVATKTHARNKKRLFREVEQSLSALGIDHIDVLLVHSVSRKEEVFIEELRDGLAELRTQGKIRFTGVSTHNTVEILNALVDDKDRFFDMALVTYNFKMADDSALSAAIERAAKSGIGIVAMKTQAGAYKVEELGDVTPHQALLKWALQNPNVSAAVPAMVDLQQVEEDTAVMGMLEITRAEERILRRYAAAVDSYYCRMCGSCEGTCPRGVAIHTVNRALMYAEGYGDLRLASATYRGLPLSRSASACDDCATCVAQCAHGLDIASKMRRAGMLLA